MNPVNTNKTKNKEEQTKIREKQAIKNKVVNGVDRGLKFSWKEYRDQTFFLKKIIYGSIISNVVLVSALVFSIETTTFFILDSQQKPISLKQLEKLPLTESRIISFSDEAVGQIFSFNYRYIEKQMNLIKKYFSEATYEKFMKEMDESNYITLVKKNKAIMTVIPTPTVFKLSVVGEDTIEVIRSFAREDISKNVVETVETAYKIVIRRVVPSDQNPWGFVVQELQEVDINKYSTRTVK